MKALIVTTFSFFISMASNAAEVMTRCSFEYNLTENNVEEFLSVDDAGKFSVQSCIREALKAREISMGSISFRYDIFTEITEGDVVDLNIGSEGWSISGEIVEKGILPSSLKITEFTNL